MFKYKRVLVKLSGGAMSGDRGFGFDHDSIEHIVKEILSIKDENIQVSVLVGGGNIFRGNVSKTWGIERAEADNIGMLGTVINSLMLRAAMQAKSGYEVRVMSASKMEAIAEPYIRLRAVTHMEKDYIVILAAGIGQPFVTTDYAAIQRAVEMRCDAVLVAKEGVDGVFNSDPKKHEDAVQYRTLAYDDFIEKKLNVMDHSAILLARDYGLPIHIFNFNESGSLKRICMDEQVGTYVSPTTTMSMVE